MVLIDDCNISLNISVDEEKPLEIFLHWLKAPESKRQYPKIQVLF